MNSSKERIILVFKEVMSLELSPEDKLEALYDRLLTLTDVIWDEGFAQGEYDKERDMDVFGEEERSYGYNEGYSEGVDEGKQEMKDVIIEEIQSL